MQSITNFQKKFIALITVSATATVYKNFFRQIELKVNFKMNLQFCSPRFNFETLLFITLFLLTS